eukprot:2347625-Rhodomonas_salina.3
MQCHAPTNAPLTIQPCRSTLPLPSPASQPVAVLLRPLTCSLREGVREPEPGPFKSQLPVVFAHV